MTHEEDPLGSLGVSSADTNPYSPFIASPTSNQATVTNRDLQLFSRNYWIVAWVVLVGAFLGVLVWALAAASLNITLSYPEMALLLLAMSSSLFALIRSYACRSRLRAFGMIKTKRRLEANETFFYLGSLWIGLLASLAGSIAFFLVCTPLGFVSIMTIGAMGWGSVVIFLLVVLISILLGSYVGWLSIYATLPEVADESEY